MKFWEDKKKVGLALAVGLFGVFALFLSVGLAFSDGQGRDHGVMEAAQAGESGCPFAGQAMDEGRMPMPAAMSGEHMHMASDSCCGGHDQETCGHHEQAESDGEAAVYTCPMHPEVVSDQPGQCPECGMNLVEKKLEKDQP